MKTYYYSLLTNKVSETITDEMREHPDTYREVAFSRVDLSNYDERTRYMNEYLEKTIYTISRKVLATDKDIVYIYRNRFSTKPDFINVLWYNVNEEPSRATFMMPPWCVFAQILARIAQIASENKSLLVSKGYMDDDEESGISIIKPSAISSSSISRREGIVSIKIHIGVQTFYERFFIWEAFSKPFTYKGCFESHNQVKKYNFRAGEWPTFLKALLLDPSIPDTTDIKAKVKLCYESLSPEEKLLGEVLMF